MNNDLQIAYQNGIDALARMEQKRNGTDKNSMAIGACYALMNAIFPDKRMNVGLDVQRSLANMAPGR